MRQLDGNVWNGIWRIGPSPDINAQAELAGEASKDDLQRFEPAVPQSQHRCTPKSSCYRSGLCYAGFQPWLNQDCRKKCQPEWAINIRAHRWSLPESNMSQHWIGFQSSTRRAREAGRQYHLVKRHNCVLGYMVTKLYSASRGPWCGRRRNARRIARSGRAGRWWE
jgi:hypothetical protein